MAERKQKGQYYILSVEDTAVSPAEFVPIACLTAKSFKVGTKVIDGTSDCGPDFLAGFPNSTCTMKGFVDYGNSAVKSGQDIFSLQAAAQNGVTNAYNFTISPAVGVAGDQSLSFTGFISNYQEDFNTDSFVEFSADIQVQGNIIQTIV